MGVANLNTYEILKTITIDINSFKKLQVIPNLLQPSPRKCCKKRRDGWRWDGEFRLETGEVYSTQKRTKKFVKHFRILWKPALNDGLLARSSKFISFGYILRQQQSANKFFNHGFTANPEKTKILYFHKKYKNVAMIHL